VQALDRQGDGMSPGVLLPGCGHDTSLPAATDISAP
jgi:hypothetical protein